MVDADISTGTDLSGKSVTDLQERVSVGKKSISGDLKYVTDYSSAFDGDEAKGHFLALHCTVPVEGATVSAVVDGTPVQAQNGYLVVHVTDKTNDLRITVSADGYEDYVRTYDLSGLTLEDLEITIDGSIADAFVSAMCLLNSNGGGTLELSADVETPEMASVEADTTIVLNGHRLSREDNGSVFQVTNGATLVIDGTAEGSAIYGRMNAGKATNSNGNIVINGGTYSCGSEQTCLHLNGTCQDSSVTIRNATIESLDDNGIQLSANGTFLIENCTISGKTGIYLKSGQMTLKDSTIISKAESHTDYKFSGNGSNPTGDAVVVDSCNYPGGIPTLIIDTGNTIRTVEGSGNTQIGYYEKTPDVEFGNVTALDDTLTVNTGYEWEAVTCGGYRLVKSA